VGCRVWGVGFGVQCLGFEGRGYRVETTVICTSVSGRTSHGTVRVLGFRFWILGLRVQG